jgi:transposase
VTETCDDECVHLITSVETSVASVSDAAMLSRILEQEQRRGEGPAELLVDTGYLSGQAIVRGREMGLEVVGPLPAKRSWQARAGAGYSAEAFEIDWAREQARCPEGRTSRRWREGTGVRGEQIVRVRFAGSDCAGCARRAECTRVRQGGRVLMLAPRAVHEAIEARRREQRTAAFAERYAARAGVEGTISQAVRVTGLRRARYRGVKKMHLQNLASAAALNLVRLSAWLGGIPHAKTQGSRLAKLASAA